MSDKRPPEIEIEKDIEKEIEIEIKNNSVIDSYNNDKSVKNVITKITDNVNGNSDLIIYIYIYIYVYIISLICLVLLSILKHS